MLYSYIIDGRTDSTLDIGNVPTRRHRDRAVEKNGRPGARRPAAQSDSHLSMTRLQQKTPKAHRVNESVTKNIAQAAWNSDNAAARSPRRENGHDEQEGIVSTQARNSGLLNPNPRHGDQLPPRNSGPRAAHH